MKKYDIYNDQLSHLETRGENDPILHENLSEFVTSTTLERKVHTKGWGAFGMFKPYQSMSNYTRLPFLQSSIKEIPVACRFSLAVSTKGTPDTSRNVRGLATKFYTDSGVFDLLCNHIPVFSVKDAIRFPESIEAFLPSPRSNLINPDRFWGFVARAPEAMHFVTWLYSDVGTIKSLRYSRYYGVNTYVWVNSQGNRKYVKYHWIPETESYITKNESVKLSGENPDISGHDLFNAVSEGNVNFDLCVQLMNPSDERILLYDPLDDTKTWNEEEYPLVRVGRLILNRNPENYEEQIEKLAFNPNNLLDGVELSADSMLQGRSTIYPDAQRHRLGNEFRKIEINGQKNWTPDSMIRSNVKIEERKFKMDYYYQAGERYKNLSEEQKNNLSSNIADDIKVVSKDIRDKVLENIYKCNDDFAKKVKSMI